MGNIYKGDYYIYTKYIYKYDLWIMIFTKIYFIGENYLYGHWYSFVERMPKYQIRSGLSLNMKGKKKKSIRKLIVYG